MSIFRKSHCIGLLAGMSFSVSAAETCQGIELYSGMAGQSVSMDQESRTWPEGPEFFTNWGEKDGMLPPYIRLSGQKDIAQDWKGVFRFGAGQWVEGGNLQMQVHPLVDVDLSVSVITSFGESVPSIVHLAGSKTTQLDIPLNQLGLSGALQVQGIVTTLLQVPKYQYTTVFFDNVRFTCAMNSSTDPTEPSESQNEAHPADLLATTYAFSEADPLLPYREVGPVAFTPNYAYVIKSNEQIATQRTRSVTSIVVSAEQHQDLLTSLAKTPLTADASVALWKNNLHELAKARLRDSVLANPAVVAKTADFIAADANHYLIPLLIADVDYEAEACDEMADTLSCQTLPLVADRYSHVALPIASVTGSKIAFVYDPQFVVTNRSESLPTIEVYTGESWILIEPKTTKVVEFLQAGVNTIRLKMHRGSYVKENVILVEVK